MKSNSILLYATLFVTAAACRKGNSDGYQAPPPSEKKATVSTFAGDGTDGYLNGPLLSARFETPIDIAISANGILYVADYNDRHIRKISGGQVSLLAGDGGFGTKDGAGDTAQFVDPYRIEVDHGGNIYVIDQADSRVRRITPNGMVSTYAGSGVAGFKDGDVSIALFRQGMGGITIDAQGIVYIDDTNNGRIRKISAAGQVSTFAGREQKGFVDGDTSVAEFLNPNPILFDRQGNMYVADNGNYCIRKITPAGMVSKFSGIGTHGMADGPAGTAQFHYIYDMVIDKDDNIFISDGDRIRKVNPAGEVLTIAGTTTGYADGDGATAQFNYPAGLAIDPEGNLYVADALNNRVRKISFK
ncbi:MAG TPA: NHL repeat-containing protein [Chitinophagaceae bacterium]|nr:NHL repeat-containing protein [Chitinophagaceae bacterium]